jgi:hypothetical protein
LNNNEICESDYEESVLQMFQEAPESKGEHLEEPPESAAAAHPEETVGDSSAAAGMEVFCELPDIVQLDQLETCLDRPAPMDATASAAQFTANSDGSYEITAQVFKNNADAVVAVVELSERSKPAKRKSNGQQAAVNKPGKTKRRKFNPADVSLQDLLVR